MEYSYGKSYPCRDCEMRFSSINQLDNHSKNFCVSSPYAHIDSLDQKARVRDILDSVSIDKSNIEKYGNYSLQALQNMIGNSHNHKLGQKVLRNREAEITNDLIKYQQTQKKIQHYQNHPELTSNQQMQTSFARNMKQPQYHSYTSPPSYLPHDTVKKNKQSQMKQQEMLSKMSDRDREAYAREKLKELEDIKLAYVQNSGNDRKFLNNLSNLEEFYEGLKLGVSNTKGSRVKTPIASLNHFEASTIEKPRMRTSEVRPLVEENRISNQRSIHGSRVLNGTTAQKKPNQLEIIHNPYQNPQSGPNYSQQYQVPMPYGSPQPIIIMPPPYYPPDYSRHSQKYNPNETNLMNRLQKLLKQKEEQPITARGNNQIAQIAPSTVALETNSQNRSQYLVQKFNNGLLPQQRVLEALQRQQFQQLRMLSNLPPQLQKVKMDIIKETTLLRSEVQKQIHQQRVLRMRHQLEMQEDHEEQIYQDEIWVDKQRKKEVSQKLIEDYQDQS